MASEPDFYLNPFVIDEEMETRKKAPLKCDDTEVLGGVKQTDEKPDRSNKKHAEIR